MTCHESCLFFMCCVLPASFKDHVLPCIGSTGDGELGCALLLRILGTEALQRMAVPLLITRPGGHAQLFLLMSPRIHSKRLLHYLLSSFSSFPRGPDSLTLAAWYILGAQIISKAKMWNNKIKTKTRQSILLTRQETALTSLLAYTCLFAQKQFSI